MIDIFKKLPGTNCGKCGVPTFTAFAFKVKIAQQKITDCPFIKKEITEVFEEKNIPIPEDNYERVSRELEIVAKQVDFKESAKAIGGGFEVKNEQEIIKLEMLNKFYEMRKDGLYEDDKYCHDSWSKIIIYDYIRKKGGKALTGNWVTLGYFPNTASHVKAFQRNAEEKISEAFNKNIINLKERCRQLNGTEDSGRMKADYICRFNLLPRVPLYLCFWGCR